MGAAFVTARYKVAVGSAEFFKCANNVFAFGFSRVMGRTNQHEVVVHDCKAFDGKALGHDFFFSHLVVHKQHIGVAPATHVDGLASADGHHLDVNTGGFFKFWQQVEEQAGLLGRGGRSHHDGCRLRY